MSLPRIVYTIDEVIAHIQNLAVDNTAPSMRTYNLYRGDMPSYDTLRMHGYKWADLVEQAGLNPAPKGAQPGNQNALSNTPTENIDAEHRSPIAAVKAPSMTNWPLRAIHTRTEQFTVRCDDKTIIRVTRDYYSLQ